MFSDCAGDDVMNESILERVNKCKRTFLLSELVDLQRVQSVGMVSDYNFRVTLVSGVEAFGKPEQYKDFLEKYMTYLELKQ